MKPLFNVLFYVTMPFRAVVVGVGILIVLLAATMDRHLLDVCDLDHAWKVIVG
jgi:hypothetical protein